MADIKKIAAAVAAASMCTFCLTGCSDTTYVLSYGDGKKVNSGVYLYGMLSQMQQQMYIMNYTQQSSTDSGSGEIDYFSQKVEGKDFATYISDESNKQIKEYAAIVAQCEKLGITLTEEETKEISDSVGDAWTSSSDMFEEMGISKESIKLYEKETKLREKLFDHYYAEKGEEEVTSEDMTKYLKENYVRYKTITISKSTEEDETKKKEADAKSEKLIEKYLKKAKKTDFTGFDEVMHEYEEETTPEEETEESTEESGTDDTSSQTESKAETDSSAADSSKADSSAADSSEADSSASDSSQVTSGGTLQVEDSSKESSKTQSDADSSAADTGDDSLVTFDPDKVGETSTTGDETTGETGEEEEEDPYAHETMYNFGKMDDETKESSTGKLVEHIKGMKIGKAEKYEDDDSYYIIVKGSVTERAESYIESNKDSLIEEMKGDEFEGKISQWEKDFSVKENTASFKRYTPKSVYDRWSEYLKDNSEATE